MRAVVNHDIEAVKQALARGASPNVWWESRMSYVLTLAMQQEQPECVALLLDAGAEVVYPTPIGRHHPEWGARVIERAMEGLALRPLSVEDAQQWVKGLDHDHPNDRQLLDVVRGHGALSTEDWWRLALGSARPFLLTYVRAHFCDPPVPFVTRLVSGTTGNKQDPLAHPDTVVVWLSSQSPENRHRFLCGNFDSPGVLKNSLDWTNDAKAAYWGAAGNDPFVMGMLEAQELLPHYTRLAMRLHGSAAYTWLRAVQPRLDVAKISVGPATDPKAAQRVVWETGWNGDDPKGTLLDLYLNCATSYAGFSSTLCRRLVQLGCRPTATTLSLLCLRLRYGRLKLLAPLFKEWVQAGADPTPVGRDPAWAHIPRPWTEAYAGILRSWYDARRMEAALPAPLPVSSPFRRRM